MKRPAADYSGSGVDGGVSGGGSCDGCLGFSIGINRKQQEKFPIESNPEVNIAEELKRLSVDERNEVYEDIQYVFFCV